MLLMLPLPLRVQPEVGNGDKGEIICGGKEIVVGGDSGAGEGRGNREILVSGRAKKRSSISVECEESSICSSDVEIGFVVAVVESLVVSFGDSVPTVFVVELL